MDDSRDLQKANSLSKYVDGHPIRTTPFGGNKAAERLYSRCERITIAIYLLTSHIEDSEPLKTRIRSAAIQLLDSGLELKEELRSLESSAVTDFMRAIRSLISLCRTGAAAGYISLNNADILAAALDEVGSFVSASQRSNFAEHISLTKEDLIGQVSPLAETSRMSFIKDIKDRRPVKGTAPKIGNSGTSDTIAASVPLSSRSQAIMQVLISGREFAIKEICANLPEYSEKMIQRELADLVDAGKVKKEGAKRWSRYSLIRGGGSSPQGDF